MQGRTRISSITDKRKVKDSWPRCPNCGRRLIIHKRRRLDYWIAVCVCGLHLQAPERVLLMKELDRIRRLRR